MNLTQDEMDDADEVAMSLEPVMRLLLQLLTEAQRAYVCEMWGDPEWALS